MIPIWDGCVRAEGAGRADDICAVHGQGAASCRKLPPALLWGEGMNHRTALVCTVAWQFGPPCLWDILHYRWRKPIAQLEVSVQVKCSIRPRILACTDVTSRSMRAARCIISEYLWTDEYEGWMHGRAPYRKATRGRGGNTASMARPSTALLTASLTRAAPRWTAPSPPAASSKTTLVPPPPPPL